MGYIWAKWGILGFSSLQQRICYLTASNLTLNPRKTAHVSVVFLPTDAHYPQTKSHSLHSVSARGRSSSWL